MRSCPKNGIAMLISNKSSIQNKLLALLPARDFDLVSRDLEHVDLPRRTPLAKFREPFTHIHFLTSGVASVVVVTPEGNKVESGIFGSEGYVPTSASTGLQTSSHDLNMQLAGAGCRMNFEAFRSLMKRSDSFAKVVGRSMEAFAVQLAYTAASNAIHDVNERLARWILMCHDRKAIRLP
jgi:CRP-like cAMP-binding protein